MNEQTLKKLLRARSKQTVKSWRDLEPDNKWYFVATPEEAKLTGVDAVSQDSEGGICLMHKRGQPEFLAWPSFELPRADDFKIAPPVLFAHVVRMVRARIASWQRAWAKGDNPSSP